MSEAELECCESVEIHQDRLKIVSDQMPEEEELYDLAELFKVFGDSTRIRILFSTIFISYYHIMIYHAHFSFANG